MDERFTLPLIFLVALYAFKPRSKGKKSLPLPPGPKPIPFIGNIFGIPLDASWKVFQEWGKKYG